MFRSARSKARPKRRDARAALALLRQASWGRAGQVSPASPNDLEDHRRERKVRHATANPAMPEPRVPRPSARTPSREQLADGRIVDAATGGPVSRRRLRRRPRPARKLPARLVGRVR